MSNLTKRLRAAEKDDRLSTGALYGESADRIEQLEAALRELVKYYVDEDEEGLIEHADPIINARRLIMEA